MAVSSLTNKLTLIPFGNGGLGRARGMLVGKTSLPGDATGGFAAIAFEIPAGHAFVPLFTSCRVAGASATRVITLHRLTPLVIDPATNQALTVDFQQQRHDGTGFYSLRTDNVILDAHELVSWPRIVFRPQAGENSGSARVNFIPNINGATFHATFFALAFDPQDAKEGLVPPFLDNMAITNPSVMAVP